MTIITANARLSRVYQAIFILGLCLYLIQGIQTELLLIARKPIPATLLEDFSFYERALIDAIAGKDPYSVRSIGPGYFYPPPALLLVEIIHRIVPFSTKITIYTLLNFAILIFIVSGVAKYYGYSIRDMWYWYVLCLGFAPFLELLHLGQINLITLFGIFLFLWGLNSSSILSGFGLSLAILTKVSPVVFLLYLAATKRINSIVSTLVWLAGMTGLSILRYGISPVLLYPETFQWLTNQFPVGPNSQSLVSKLIMVFGVNLSDSGIPIFQTVLMLYIFSLIVVSSFLTIRGDQSREPLFIVTALGVTIMPNVMWYHHYVFFLLPFLIWMAWMRLSPRVVLWCLMGMLIIQSDRFYLTDGFLIHVFVHVSIISILVWQVQHYFVKNELKSPVIGERQGSV